MEDCVFCKIVAGEIPSYQVYQDQDFLGFLDIHPRTRGHTLVIPKKHYRWIYEVPNFAEYWLATLKITKAMQGALNPTFITYLTHGLEVSHAHIWILPRKNESAFVPEVIRLSESEMQAIAEKISKAI